MNVQERVRDVSKYSKSTINVQKSMIKWVNKYIAILTNQNSEALMKEISNSNFSVGYLSSILRMMELKIVSENLQIVIPDTIRNLRKRKRVKKKRRSMYYEGVRKMVLFVLKQISDIRQFKLSTGELVTRAQLEAYVMIVLVFLTALRSNEVTQLTVHDLYKIKEKLPVYVKIKKRKRPVVIGIVPDFFELMYPLLIFILAEGYDQIIPNEKLSSRFATLHDKQQFILKPNESTIRDNSLFTCHRSTLNKEIKNIYTKVNGEEHSNESVGVQGVRSLILTELINVGDPEIAAYFTRHRNPNTTTTYYNNPNPVEAFDKLKQGENL
jgi:integrase